MTARSSILAWVAPWTEEPGGLQALGSDTTEATKQHRRARTCSEPDSLPAGKAGGSRRCKEASPQWAAHHTHPRYTTHTPTPTAAQAAQTSLLTHTSTLQHTPMWFPSTLDHRTHAWHLYQHPHHTHISTHTSPLACVNTQICTPPNHAATPTYLHMALRPYPSGTVLPHMYWPSYPNPPSRVHTHTQCVHIHFHPSTSTVQDTPTVRAHARAHTHTRTSTEQHIHPQQLHPKN